MPDVKVLVHAHRQQEGVHELYRDWVEQLVSSAQPFGLSVLVGVGFLRIVTNGRIDREPTPLPVAVAALQSLSERSNCRVLTPGATHLSIVESACRRAKAAGQHVVDAQHAAVAIEHGCQWVTRDDDFERFESSGLRWMHLLP